MQTFSKEDRYPVAHVEFDCMACGSMITEVYFPTDCLCCDCIDKGYDETWENGQPIIIEPTEIKVITVAECEECGSFVSEIVWADYRDGIVCVPCYESPQSHKE